MTSPTDASVQRPRSNPRPPPSPRPVIPAATPKRSRQSSSRNRGTGPVAACSRSSRGAAGAARGSVITALDVGPEIPQALVDPFVAALDLADVVDGALSLGRQRG